MQILLPYAYLLFVKTSLAWQSLLEMIAVSTSILQLRSRLCQNFKLWLQETYWDVRLCIFYILTTDCSGGLFPIIIFSLSISGLILYFDWWRARYIFTYVASSFSHLSPAQSAYLSSSPATFFFLSLLESHSWFNLHWSIRFVIHRIHTVKTIRAL